MSDYLHLSLGFFLRYRCKFISQSDEDEHQVPEHIRGLARYSWDGCLRKELVKLAVRFR